MGAVFSALLPFMIASMVLPLPIILAILLLKSSDRGLLKSAAFLSGMTVVRILQGFVFGWFIFDPYGADGGEAGGKGPVGSALMLVIGVILLISAYRKWIKQPDPDDPPPAWMTTIEQASPWKAFQFGMLLLTIGFKNWVIMFGALNVLGGARLGQPLGTLAFLLYVLIISTPMLLPILTRILMPQQSTAMLATVSKWLDRNNRTIMIAVALVFGLLFFYQGINGFLK